MKLKCIRTQGEREGTGASERGRGRQAVRDFVFKRGETGHSTETVKETDRQTETEAERVSQLVTVSDWFLTSSQPHSSPQDTETEATTETETGRQADRQTDRQTDRGRESQ